MTVTFGPEPDGSDNFLYVMDGWNYAPPHVSPSAGDSRRLVVVPRT